MSEVKYHVVKNFQAGAKHERVHYKEKDVFLGNPNDSFVKELAKEGMIKELSVVLNEQADELKKKSDEAEKKASLFSLKAKEAAQESEKSKKQSKGNNFGL